MKDLSFDVELTWSGTGLQGVGQIQTDDVALDPSGPESMGGRHAGAHPAEMFVCAVSTCYTATLFAVLRRAQLRLDSLAVAASGTVTGFPTVTRFARIVVTPRIIRGDIARQSAYEAAAALAHDRCFIGRTLAPDVAYEVSFVHVRGERALPRPPTSAFWAPRMLANIHPALGRHQETWYEHRPIQCRQGRARSRSRIQGR